MKTLMVTGASGFLGSHVCRLAQGDWDVVGVHRAVATSLPSLPGVRWASCDLTQFQQLEALFDSERPAAVLHLAAEARPEHCQRDPEVARRINVDVPCHVAELCAARHIDLVFASTDLVFDGRHAPYREGDSVGPVNVYGEQKAAAEHGILWRYPKAAICRLPLLFGPAPPGKASCLQPLIARLRSGEQQGLFVDEYRTPLSGTAAASGMLQALAERWRGVVHLGGTERISRFELGVEVARLLQVSSESLVAMRQVEVQTLAPRAADVSLDSSRARALGFAPPPLAEDLRAAVAECSC